MAGSMASIGYPSRFHSSNPPRSGRTRFDPQLVQRHSRFGGGGFAGAGAIEHHVAVPGNLVRPGSQSRPAKNAAPRAK